MSNEEFLCARCARHTQTCCQATEVHVTVGDVKRIEQYTGREDFFEFRAPVKPTYADQDDDPVWREKVFRPDGTRRVLKWQPNLDCTFLGPHGCTLPQDVRPLICRIFPYDYTADGILPEFAEGCPLELLRPGQGLIEALDMNLEVARRWHAQLYQEIGQEEDAIEPSECCLAAVAE